MAQLLVNGFNIGTELQNVILSVVGGPSFPVEQIGHLKEMNFRQQSTKAIVTPVSYGGKRLHRNIYHDWAGELMFTRFNGDLTNLINGVMQNFQQNGLETYFTIYATVANTTAGVASEDEYLFQQCVIDDHDGGRFSGLSEVDNSFAFRCQSMILPGSANNVLLSGASILGAST